MLLEFKEQNHNFYYYGPLFVGSNYEYCHVIYDTMSSITSVNLENARGKQSRSTYDFRTSETAEAVYVVSYDSEGDEFEQIKTGTLQYGEHIVLSGKKYMDQMCLI